MLRRWRGFGREDYALCASVSCGVLRCRGFDAEAEEHFAAAEVGLGSVIEDVLFLDARLGASAEIFDFAKYLVDVGDAEFDFDFWFCVLGFWHRDSIGRCCQSCWRASIIYLFLALSACDFR